MTAKTPRQMGYQCRAEGKKEEAFNWFVKGAKEGDAECIYFAADAYYRGEGVKKDYAHALEWFQQAWQKSYHRAAALAVGDMHRNGQGVPADYAQALDWYKKVSRGNGSAQFAIGELYETGGPGLKKNEAEAERRFVKSAKLGYAEAAKKLPQAQRVELMESEAIAGRAYEFGGKEYRGKGTFSARAYLRLMEMAKEDFFMITAEPPVNRQGEAAKAELQKASARFIGDWLMKHAVDFDFGAERNRARTSSPGLVNFDVRLNPARDRFFIITPQCSAKFPLSWLLLVDPGFDPTTVPKNAPEIFLGLLLDLADEHQCSLLADGKLLYDRDHREWMLLE